MVRKVVNTTHSASKYDILSQTPKNFDRDNYFIKELQDKVWAEWDYRPNRFDIFYEDEWGEQTYSPIEVVMQSVKSEKGEYISDDCRKLVFRDILERRFKIGSRFKFGSFPLEDGEVVTANSQQNVWISTNTNSMKVTSSMVVERCNGTLGSLYKDEQGIAHYHYEPVIQGRTLSGVHFLYNEVAIQDQSQLVVTSQYNNYTKQYFINQRFIVGPGDSENGLVYRIVGFNKTYSTNTFDAEQVGLMVIYMEQTEKSPYDDFVNRIAYQGDQSPAIIEEKSSPEDDPSIEYYIAFETPEVIPASITTEEVVFEPKVKNNSGETIENIPINLSYSMENLPSTVSPTQYVNITPENDGKVRISCRRIYLGGKLIVEWNVDAEDSPSGKEMNATCQFDLR